MSDSLRPHGLQQNRLPCSSPTPGVYPNSWQLNRWCHPAISFSVIPFFSHPQSFPASQSFPMSQFFARELWWPEYWSFSFRISSSNEYSGLISFRMGWLAIRAVQGTLNSLFQHHSSKASILQHSTFFIVQLSHPFMTTAKKNIALTGQTCFGKLMSLLFNMLSRLIIAFLPRSKHLLISWLQSLSAVISGAQENEVCHCFHCFPIYLPWSDGTSCHELSFFECRVVSQLFHSPLSLSSRGSLVPLRILS